MPIYEYKCEACAHELEALQKMSDDPLKDCPECGGATLIKKVSAAAFRLKGGGWYETDFKSGNKKNIANSDSSSANSSSADSKAGDKNSKAGEAKPSDSSKTKASTSKGGASSSSAKKSET